MSYSPFRPAEQASLCVALRDKDLVGAQGGIKVLHHLKPHTLSLDLSHNHLLGTDGLKVILDELCVLGGDDVALETLLLVNCGFGGPGQHYSTTSLDLLASYLPRLPNLSDLLLTNNDLTTLTPAFIRAVLAHPRLRNLGLSTNERLGVKGEGQSQSPILRFLKAYHRHALSAGPDFNLRVLRLDQTSLSGAEIGGVLLDVIRLNERGLEELTVNGNEDLGSDVLDNVRRAIDPPEDEASILDGLALDGSQLALGNHFCVKLETRASETTAWLPMENQLAAWLAAGPVLPAPTTPRIDISAKLYANLLERSLTRDAALQLLKASRPLLHAFPASPCQTSALSSGAPFRILDLPEEILLDILAAVVDSGALGPQQTAAVLAFARDRGTLRPGVKGRFAGARRERQREEWLRSVGAWWFEPPSCRSR